MNAWLLVAVFLPAMVIADPVQKPDEPVAPAPKAVAEVDHAAAMAKYNELREKAKNTADSQWKLGLWCQEHGLDAEAYAHFAAVVKLDPTRVAAWHRLGFQKHNGRWMSEDQIAEEAEQKKADHVWGPLLSKLHRQYHTTSSRAEAEDGFAKIDDPRAIPPVFRELAMGGPGDQTLAIQIFGQIKGQASSQALALLAVHGASAEVRRRATETLKGRDSSEYADMLVKLLVDPIKYEVRRVGGANSPGILLIEGQKANVRRVYAPPPPASVRVLPGDFVGVDAYGMPLITRPGEQIGPSFTPSAPTAQQLNSVLARAGVKPPSGLNAIEAGGPLATPPVLLANSLAVQFSVGQSLLEAQRATVSAQQQLDNDVKQLDTINKNRSALNDRVVNILKDATGQDPGADRESWKNWLSQQKGYQKDPDQPKPKPTLSLLVPLGYTPAFPGQLTMVVRTPPPDH